MPHAILLTGPAGVGKHLFAAKLSQLLLCKNPDWNKPEPCNQCDACQRFAHDAHPDYRLLAPQEGKKEIVVDDVRDLLKFINLSAQVNQGYKVTYIAPADAMNRNASNALLKTLEEPPERRVLILHADSLHRLPPTIRSRCRLIRFPSVDKELSAQWLEQVTGKAVDAELLAHCDYSPLRYIEKMENAEAENSSNTINWSAQLRDALEHKSRALVIAQQWAESSEESDLIDCIQREIMISIRALLGRRSDDQCSVFAQLGYALTQVLKIHSKIIKIASQRQTQVNKRLVWENFLLDCHRIRATG